jgi:hypothetical protein
MDLLIQHRKDFRIPKISILKIDVSFGVFLTISHFLGFDFCSDALRREDDET